MSCVLRVEESTAQTVQFPRDYGQCMDALLPLQGRYVELRHELEHTSTGLRDCAAVRTQLEQAGAQYVQVQSRREDLLRGDVLQLQRQMRILRHRLRAGKGAAALNAEFAEAFRLANQLGTFVQSGR